MKLFLSTISAEIVILLLDNKNKLLAKVKSKVERKSSTSIFFKKIRELLKENNIELKNVDKLYFLTGEDDAIGSKSGHNISKVMIDLIIFIRNNLTSGIKRKLEVFAIDNLIFQTGKENKCLSAVSVGNNKKNFSIAIIKNDIKIFEKKLINLNDFNNIINEYPDYKLICDLENINFLENFLISIKNKKFVKYH